MYNSGQELLQRAKEKDVAIYEIVIENECLMSEMPLEKVKENMEKILDVMLEASSRGLEDEIKSVSGLIGGDARRVEIYRRNGNSVCGDAINKAMARAMSCSEVNSAMGRIVAAPTAGSNGILPAAIITAAETLGLEKEKMVNGLFTAAGIGQIISGNATVSGAEGGCQAECGSAAAMAAAAVVEMAGGSPEMCFHAASIALKNILGLVCDPIAGLVEVPCILRNSSGTINALTSADLALAGVKSLIPFDEVVDSMYKVGKALPNSLKETAAGGLAATPTGIRLRKEILGE